MLPQSYTRDAFTSVTTRVLATAAADLNIVPSYATDDRPAVVKEAANVWAPVHRHLELINEGLDSIGENNFQTWLDTDLTEDARSARTLVHASSVTSTIETASRQIIRATTRVLDMLREAGYPPRPEPHDAAQEAALANTKADLKMVLDPITDAPVIKDKIAELLRRASTQDDKLTAWVLASSNWPRDYLESRGALPGEIETLDSQLASVLDEVSPPNLSEIRQTYRRLTQRYGLGALITVLNATLPQIVEEYRTWRPTQAA